MLVFRKTSRSESIFSIKTWEKQKQLWRDVLKNAFLNPLKGSTIALKRVYFSTYAHINLDLRHVQGKKLEKVKKKLKLQEYIIKERKLFLILDFSNSKL